MSAELADKTTHTVRVSAPAGVVYALIADAVKWPLYVSPVIHVEQPEFDGERGWLRMWSLRDGRLESWTSWRHLDPVERRVEFRQELPASPFNSMSGTVQVRSTGPHRTELELRYDVRAAEGTAGHAAWVERAADGGSRAHLAGLKAFAERWTRLDELVLSFEDAVRIHGPAELVYDFLYRAGNWPGLVPHVTRVDLTEDAPGVQHLTMQTQTESGAHTTQSVRICFPHAGRIVYKETATSALLQAHTGEWSVVPDETGVTVIAQHSVVLREEHIAAVLGGHAGVAHARRYVRDRLGRQCLAVLAQAEKHAQSAVRML
ncbi:aromatase/cyclase [Streptomyces sp. NPDC002814]